MPKEIIPGESAYVIERLERGRNVPILSLEQLEKKIHPHPYSKDVHVQHL